MRRLFVTVMLRMGLAGLGGMVMGVMAVARSGMGVMRRAVGIVVFIMLGGFAVMLRGLFVMFGGIVMMLAGGVLVRHGVLLNRPRRMAWLAAAQRGFAKQSCQRRGLPKTSSVCTAATRVANHRHQTVAPTGFDDCG
jgi:hypothetical protein